MSTQLKPYLKDIADKIRDKRENLYDFYNVIWYSHDETDAFTKGNNGVVVNVSQVPYVNREIFIDLGDAQSYIGKSLECNIDEVQNINIGFKLFDNSVWDSRLVGEKGTSNCKVTLTVDGYNDFMAYNYVSNLVLAIEFPSDIKATYNINNITIKDVSPINAKDYSAQIDNVHQSGVKDGRNICHKDFWDNYTANLISGAYTSKYAFAGVGWNDKTFKPKYDMNVSHSLMMFRYSLITDLTNLSVNIDFSKSRTAKQIFEYSTIKHIGDFNVSGVRDSSETTGMFSNCSMLHTIDKFTVKSAKFAVGNFIPVIGNFISDSVDILLSSSILIKNIFGTIGLLLLIGVCLIPILKIFSVILVYKIGAAIVEPIGEENISKFMEETSKLMTVILICILALLIMFFVTIGILTSISAVS